VFGRKMPRGAHPDGSFGVNWGTSGSCAPSPTLPRKGGGGMLRRASYHILQAHHQSGAPAGWLTGVQTFFSASHSVTTASLTSSPRCAVWVKS